MIHTDDHDPLLMHRLCWPCHQAMSSAAARVHDVNPPLNQIVPVMRGLAMEALAVIVPAMARRAAP